MLFKTSIWLVFIFSQNLWALDFPVFQKKIAETGIPSSAPVAKPCVTRQKIQSLNILDPGLHPLREMPFWKFKTDLYRQIQEEKRIVVKTHSTSENNQKVLDLLTAGQIRAPLPYVYDQIMDMDNLSKRISYIQESKFDASTSNLFIHGALLGYHIRMTMKIRPFRSSKGEAVLFWESIAGGLVGLKGDITLSEAGAERTEISMRGFYKGETLPIPGIILDWGLEIAGQRASSAMRSAIEESYAQCPLK